MLNILAQAMPGTPIGGLSSNVQWAVIGILGLLAVLAAQRASTETRLPAALTFVAGGLVAALALGFGAWGIGGAVAAAGYYLAAAAALQLYTVARADTLPLWFIVLGLGAAVVFYAMGAAAGAFSIAAGVAVFGAVKVTTAREVMHAVVWLAAALVGVAGIFLTTGAEFLAAIQVLVYVGAVITLFLFTVMLTIPAQESHFLDEIDVPPGFTIENVQDLEEVVPGRGSGPMKGFDHPRRAVKQPVTLYGVSLADEEYGREDSPVKKGVETAGRKAEDQAGRAASGVKKEGA